MSLWTIAVIIVSAAVGVTPVLWLAQGERVAAGEALVDAELSRHRSLKTLDEAAEVRDEAKQLLDAAGALLTMRAGPKLVTRIGR